MLSGTVEPFFKILPSADRISFLALWESQKSILLPYDILAKDKLCEKLTYSRHPKSEEQNVKITITLQDDKDGQVQVEEVRQLSPGEHEETVTAASALAEEMLAFLDELGDAEIASENV